MVGAPAVRGAPGDRAHPGLPGRRRKARHPVASIQARRARPPANCLATRAPASNRLARTARPAPQALDPRPIRPSSAPARRPTEVVDQDSPWLAPDRASQEQHGPQQPAARRLHRQEALPLRRAVPGSDPGRQHRFDARGGKVRSSARLQVLDLRYLVGARASSRWWTIRSIPARMAR